MDLYCFHLRRTGRVILDPEGIRLAGVDVARREAVQDARALVAYMLSLCENVHAQNRRRNLFPQFSLKCAYDANLV